MLQVGDRVRVKAETGGPDIAPHFACFRLRLWGLVGIVVDIVPQLPRSVVVAFVDPFVPDRVRFRKQDLREVIV